MLCTINIHKLTKKIDLSEKSCIFVTAIHPTAEAVGFLAALIIRKNMNAFEKYIELKFEADRIRKVIDKLCCAYLMSNNTVCERVCSARAIKFLSWDFTDKYDMSKVRIYYKEQDFNTKEERDKSVEVPWSELVFNVNDYE